MKDPWPVRDQTRLEVLDDPLRFDRLRESWADLLSRSASDSLSVTWEWLSTWWSVFGAEREMRILLVWRGALLIGAAPLLARKASFRYFSVLPFKRWELMASGEPENDEICSDYLDWIADRDWESVVVEVIVEGLAGVFRSQWQEILLPDVSAQSATLGRLAAVAANHGLSYRILKRASSPYIALPASWDDYFNGVSSKFRHKLRRCRRDFEAKGYLYRVASSAADLQEFYPQLVELHQRRWRARGSVGVFSSAPFRSFHEKLMPIALQLGWLRLGVLSVSGAPIGAIYSFHYRRRVYFYQTGIEPQESTYLRPGMLMHMHEIEAAIGAGCTEYDFLQRDRFNYKDEWATHSRDLLHARLSQGGWRDRARGAGLLGVAQLRRVKRSLGA